MKDNFFKAKEQEDLESKESKLTPYESSKINSPEIAKSKTKIDGEGGVEIAGSKESAPEIFIPERAKLKRSVSEISISLSGNLGRKGSKLLEERDQSSMLTFSSTRQRMPSLSLPSQLKFSKTGVDGLRISSSYESEEFDKELSGASMQNYSDSPGPKAPIRQASSGSLSSQFDESKKFEESFRPLSLGGSALYEFEKFDKEVSGKLMNYLDSPGPKAPIRQASSGSLSSQFDESKKFEELYDNISVDLERSSPSPITSPTTATAKIVEKLSIDGNKSPQK